MDITFGTHPEWDGYEPDTNNSGFPDDFTTTAGETQYLIRRNVYTQMQQILVGRDPNNNLRKFDRDGNFSDTADDVYNNCVFISFSRLLVKDEIKKGTFRLELGVGQTDLSVDYTANSAQTQIFQPADHDTDGSDEGGTVLITDTGAQDEYRVNSPVGEYAILKLQEIDGPDDLTNVDDTVTNDGIPVGLIYYQAGIIVLNLDWMADSADTPADPGGPNESDENYSGPEDDANLSGGITPNYLNWFWDPDQAGGSEAINWYTMIKGAYTINNLAEGFRHRINKIQFNNTTELNSTIYFCRAKANEFNYSSNPSYLSGSKIAVKENSTDMPVSYITTVGLYSADQELLAVAKLSEPLKKDPTNELALRVRLDY